MSLVKKKIVLKKPEDFKKIPAKTDFTEAVARLDRIGPDGVRKAGKKWERKYLEKPAVMDPRVLKMISGQVGKIRGQIDG